MVRGMGGRPYVPRGRGGYRGGTTGTYRGRSDSRSYDAPRRYDSYDSRQPSRFPSNDRYSSSRSRPDFKRPMTHHYREDTRDRRVSPDRKRFRRDYSSSSQKRAGYNRDHDKSDGEREVDLENFLTVDEVGDVDLDMAMVEFPDDAEGPADQESPKKDAPTDKDKDKEPAAGSRDSSKSKSERINVGSEWIKKVETYFCTLCRIWLDSRDLKEAANRHCGTRAHLQRYVKHKDHKQLVEEAEKLHRSNQEKRAAAKAAAAAKKATTSESGENAEVVVKKEPSESPKKAASTTTTTTTAAGNEEDKESDEKMWESVDKDLGDLLREVAPEVADEDEDGEDSRNNTERYDRFKNSDKAGEGDADTTVATGETPKEPRAAKTNGTAEEKAPAAAAAAEKPAEVTA